MIAELALPLRRLDWRPPVAAAAAGAGYVLGTYASLVAPIEYVYRPLVVVIGLGIVVGVAVAGVGRWATLLAVALAAILVQPGSAPFFALIAAALFIVAYLRRQPIDASWVALAVTVAFCGIGIVRIVPSISLPDEVPARSERPVYLIMLDGYPRIDSLAEHGIDNAPFIEDLEARGFDHYPDAHSLHRWTDRTLTALLSRQPDGIPDEVSEGVERVEVHAALHVPDGYVAIAPPVGHVVMDGPTLPVHSVNDFEAHLIGRSLPAMVIPDQLRAWIRADLDRRLTESLELLPTVPGPVFAHLMAPHPPFVGGPECWPECEVFQHMADLLGVSVEDWWRRMGEYLPRVNDALIEAVDAILAAHPDATIVLFSDHGGRSDESDMDEWYRTLLVARTPRHSQLFAADPRPDAILRLIEASTRQFGLP